MTDTPTAEEIAQHYKAMGHSVDLINNIVAGNKDEDMTAVNAAITAGNGYTAS